MKEFDLEKARAGRPVCTRDGREARIIAFDRLDSDYPVVAMVRDIHEKRENILVYTREGKMKKEWTTPDDLMMIPEKHTAWVNMYRSKTGCGLFFGCPYETEALAKDTITSTGKYLKTIKVEWEDDDDGEQV